MLRNRHTLPLPKQSHLETQQSRIALAIHIHYHILYLKNPKIALILLVYDSRINKICPYYLKSISAVLMFVSSQSYINSLSSFNAFMSWVPRFNY